MRKNRFVEKDSDYFEENEPSIKLDFCAEGGNRCSDQMAFMNENITIARKHIENKEFSKGIDAIKIAYDSSFELKETQCLGCANLFRAIIARSLDLVIQDLEQMNTGFWSSKKFKSDLERAKKTLLELKETSDKNLPEDK